MRKSLKPVRMERQAGRLGQKQFRAAAQHLRRLLPRLSLKEAMTQGDPGQTLFSRPADPRLVQAADLPDPAPSGLDWFWLGRQDNSAEPVAVIFRSGDPLWLRIRSLFVKSVIFAGAGPGTAETCTLGALEALERCDICFYDALVDPWLLERLPSSAEQVNVGKRCGHHAAPQSGINAMLADAARRGQRVVRLKSGDPGIFGRLAEETETLDKLHLPYRVIPGVSSLNAATTGTGMLLTRRGVSRGFSVMTPRQQNGGTGSIGSLDRAALPMVFFMGILVIGDIVAQLRADGLPAKTPVAVVFDAGTAREIVVRGCLRDIEGKVTGRFRRHRGLVIVGSPAASAYQTEWGALLGGRVLLPSDLPGLKDMVALVRDFGGVPLSESFDSITPERLPVFDAIVFHSKSAVKALLAKVSASALAKKTLVAANPGIGLALKKQGMSSQHIIEAATVCSAIEALAATRVWQRLEETQ